MPDDQAMRVDAIRAAASYEDEAVGKQILERYGTFSSSEKAEAIQPLASRRQYGPAADTRHRCRARPAA